MEVLYIYKDSVVIKSIGQKELYLKIQMFCILICLLPKPACIIAGTWSHLLFHSYNSYCLDVIFQMRFIFFPVSWKGLVFILDNSCIHGQVRNLIYT